MSENRKVLVTGATGRQGGAVARELLSHGYRVSAFTRTPESENAQAIKKLGAEIIKGDFDDPTSVQRALSGFWGVFSVQDTWSAGVEKEEVQGKRLAELARKAGIEHFVYTSVASAHRNTGIPHFENKWRIEQTIRSLAFPSFAIMRPVFFMENFLTPWFKPYIDQGTLAMALKPTTSLQLIAVADIGKYGLWLFQISVNNQKPAYDIAGDAKTMPELAALLSKAKGKPVSHFQVPIEEVRKASEDFAIMLEWFDRVGYNVEINRQSKESGVAPTRFEDWAARTAW